MKLVVNSMSVFDDIQLADGREILHVAGGAGIYALAGMKIWQDDVVLVTGVGADYDQILGGWFRQNNLSTAGLMVKDPHTPNTKIVYFPDGERIETPAFGLDHFQKLEATPAEILARCQDAAGLYIFKNAERDFWQEILAEKPHCGFKLMWEIAADATEPANLEWIREICCSVDVLSINRTELLSLFDLSDFDTAVQALQAWAIPLVFLRMGKQGALMLHDGKITPVPRVDLGEVVDVTGGGNSSSGAVLAGFCQGRSPVECGLMGSISAACCLEQYGVPDRIDAGYQQRAASVLKQELAKIS